VLRLTACSVAYSRSRRTMGSRMPSVRSMRLWSSEQPGLTCQGRQAGVQILRADRVWVELLELLDSVNRRAKGIAQEHP
jgi:hypothetical protein